MSSDVNEALRQLLLSDSNIATAVGNTRVINDQLPARVVLPCIIYFEVSTDISNSLTGIIGASLSRYQVDAYASTRVAASKLQRMVARRLGAYIGKVDDYPLKTSRMSGERADTDRPSLGSAGFRYIASIDYQVLHFPFYQT